MLHWSPDAGVELVAGGVEPLDQPAQRVTGVAHGLRPVQVQAQLALDDGPDPGWRPGRSEPLDPAACVDPTCGAPVDLADVEQQQVRGVQPGDCGGEVGLGWIQLRRSAVAGSSVELTQGLGPQS